MSLRQTSFGFSASADDTVRVHGRVSAAGRSADFSPQPQGHALHSASAQLQGGTHARGQGPHHAAYNAHHPHTNGNHPAGSIGLDSAHHAKQQQWQQQQYGGGTNTARSSAQLPHSVNAALLQNVHSTSPYMGPTSAPQSLFANSDLRQLTGASLRLESLRADSMDPLSSFNLKHGTHQAPRRGTDFSQHSPPLRGGVAQGSGAPSAPSWSEPDSMAGGAFQQQTPASSGLRQYSVSAAGAAFAPPPQQGSGGGPVGGSDVKQAGYSLLSMSWDSVGASNSKRTTSAGVGRLNSDLIQAPSTGRGGAGGGAAAVPKATIHAAAAGIAHAIERSDTLRVSSWRQGSGTGESGLFSVTSGHTDSGTARDAKRRRSGGGGDSAPVVAVPDGEGGATRANERSVPTVQPGTQMHSMDAKALADMLGDDDDAEGGEGGFSAPGTLPFVHPSAPPSFGAPPVSLPMGAAFLPMQGAASLPMGMQPMTASHAPAPPSPANRGGGQRRSVGGGSSHRHDGGESVISDSASSRTGSYAAGAGGGRSRATAGSRALPTSAVRILKEWMLAPENYDHPWPTEEEKQQLADKCGITVRQVTVWLTNGRKRVWKPLREAQGLPVTDYKQARSAKKRAELSSIAKAGGAGGGGTKRPRSEEGMQGGAPTPAPSPAAAAAERDQLIALHSSLAGMLSQLQGAVQQLQAADALKEQQSAQLAQAAQAVLSQTQDSACDGRARQLLALLASGQQQRGQHQQQQGRRR